MPNVSQSDGGGYFRIYQADDPSFFSEGSDPDNLSMTVTRSNSTKHVLQFTVRLRPDEYRRDLFFSTNTGVVTAQATPPTPNGVLADFSVPDYMRPSKAPGANANVESDLANVLASRWAEVAYFLRDTGQTTPGGTPLYGLYRRQKLLVEPNGTMPTVTATPAQLIDVSTWPPGAAAPKVNGPDEITVPARRFGAFPGAMSPKQVNGSNVVVGPYNPLTGPPTLNTYKEDDTSPGSSLVGGDLLLTDVVSFEIKVMWDVPTDMTKFSVSAGPGPNAVYPPQPTGNADYPFDYLPVGRNPYFNGAANATRTPYRVFDTWSQQKSDADGYNFLDAPDAGGQQSKDATDPTWNFGQFKGDTRMSFATVPLRVRVRAVQIKLRIWDLKSQQTRQMTIIQDL
jgi:hypothetical protein